MTLHLTNRDIAGLRRSPDVATDEIRFVDGGMRFLDIAVVETTGGAPSRLDDGAAG